MIDGCYKIMAKDGHYEGFQKYSGYKQKFEYCVNQDFLYDHRDYFNIPGLSFPDRRLPLQSCEGRSPTIRGR
jgi:hypothetical protein